MGQSCSCCEEDTGEKYTDLKQEKDDEEKEEKDQESDSKNEEENMGEIRDRCNHCEENLCCCAVCLYILIESSK